MKKIFFLLILLFSIVYANISIAVLEPLSGNADAQTKSIFYDKIFDELKNRKFFNVITKEEINNKLQSKSNYKSVYYDNKYTAKIAHIINVKYVVCSNITQKNNIFIFDVKIMEAKNGKTIENIHLDCIGCSDEITRMESMRLVSNKIANYVTDYDVANKKVESKEVFVLPEEKPQSSTAMKLTITIISVLLLASGVSILFLF